MKGEKGKEEEWRKENGRILSAIFLPPLLFTQNPRKS
jgi:hypothetical protein